jgi:hypothetical protein
MSEVKEVVATRRSFVGRGEYWISYVVRTAHRRFSFRVLYRDCWNVNGRLGEALGCRFVRNLDRVVTPLHEWLFRAVGLFLFTGGCIWPGFLVNGENRLDVFLFLICANVVLLSLWLYFLWRTPDQNTSSAESPRRPKRRRAASGRPPFRSRALGWVVKLFAVGYACAVTWLNVRIARLPEEWNASFEVVRPYLGRMLYVPALLMLYLGFRLSLRTFAPGAHRHEKNVVLYLRSFADDARTSLQPRGLLAELYGILPDWTDLRLASSWLRMLHPVRMVRLFFNAGAGFAEEDYARGMAGIGPLIAVGRPNEPLGVPGADRMYLRDAEWQAVVLDYLGRSRAVILQPSGSDGVRWEIEQAVARLPPQRLLLSMLNFYRMPNEYERFREWLWLRTGVRVPALVPHLRRPCFVDFDGDYQPGIQALCYCSPFLWPITGAAVNVRRTFARFLAGLDGGRRPAPPAPRDLFLEEIGSLVMYVFVPAALFIAAGIGCWPFN